MGNARRAIAEIIYNNRDISNYATDFVYTDNTDKTDDISVRLSDSDERWANEWFPETGDTMECGIRLLDWNKDGDNRGIPLGKFEVDSIDYSDIVTIDAVSVPITGNSRSERKSRAWKEISLRKIAGDIAANAELVLNYEADIEPYYDKSDQNGKSDLDFLEELCKSDGLCMKVTDGKLIIFDESVYDTLPAVAIIKKGSSDIIGKPKFRRSAKNIYTACEISYFDPKTDKTYTGYYEAPTVGGVGHILRLRENFNSEKDDINLDRKAKARLREQNKNEWVCDITLKGDITYFAGTNIIFEGWYKFDGKYHIRSCSHNICNNGYTVKLITRRCLEGY